MVNIYERLYFIYKTIIKYVYVFTKLTNNSEAYKC